jgi:hypothetical protein
MGPAEQPEPWRAAAGVVAGFWHVLWLAGVGIVASGLVGVGVHSAGYWRLERDR